MGALLIFIPFVDQAPSGVHHVVIRHCEIEAQVGVDLRLLRLGLRHVRRGHVGGRDPATVEGGVRVDAHLLVLHDVARVPLAVANGLVSRAGLVMVALDAPMVDRVLVPGAVHQRHDGLEPIGLVGERAREPHATPDLDQVDDVGDARPDEKRWLRAREAEDDEHHDGDLQQRGHDVAAAVLGERLAVPDPMVLHAEVLIDVRRGPPAQDRHDRLVNQSVDGDLRVLLVRAAQQVDQIVHLDVVLRAWRPGGGVLALHGEALPHDVEMLVRQVQVPEEVPQFAGRDPAVAIEVHGAELEPDGRHGP
mmetsp:Transcript_52701/g.160190  ORF Transcript_52701/g.160190 Transcript_52701/m.160190 type:complete len:306 (-) Transcript_52701:969-1886(-)